MLPLSFFKHSEYILRNIDLFQLYFDNKEFKEDFSAVMNGAAKNLFQKGL